MQNVSKARPGVVLDILGDEHVLVYSMWSVAQIKKMTGINLMQATIIDFMNPELLPALIWGGLIGKYPKYDGFFVNGQPDKRVQEVVMQIAKELRGSKVREAMQAANDAFNEAFPKPEAEEKNDEAMAGESESKSDESGISSNS